ncbi:MAG: gamma-glutamylcyclotransferase [Spirochaetaceae bacterium]|nr:gamma-glutamylcyclotransferase [Spirochaetaceae bacterium]
MGENDIDGFDYPVEEVDDFDDEDGDFDDEDLPEEEDEAESIPELIAVEDAEEPEELPEPEEIPEESIPAISAEDATTIEEQTEETIFYLAYGPTMDSEQMLFLCPDAQKIKSLEIRNYQLEFCHHATVIPRRNSVVPAVLWEIPAGDEKKLDRYEGYPRYFEKKTFSVPLEDDIYLDALFYTMKLPMTFAPPTKQYLRTIKNGYVQNQLNEKPLIDALNRALQGT